jgi:Plasmid pRiA4b ORF-3-like protein
MAKRKTTGAADDAQERAARPRTHKPATNLYQIKITLKDLRPAVWRRVLVPDCSLARLHEIIQAAMGWDNDHLYEFEVEGVRYTDPEFMDDLETEDASRSRLSRIVPKEKMKLIYTYDFGDDWRHEVLVEKILPPEEGKGHPVCVAGKRACPPENVGGPWGYVDLIEAFRDPKHERHEEFMEWLSDFDPEAFDLDAVNKDLSRLR